MPEVRVLPRTIAYGYFDHNYLGLLEKVTDHLGDDRPEGLPRQRLWKVRAGQVVLATGAIERPWCSATTTGPASCWPAPAAPT